LTAVVETTAAAGSVFALSAAVALVEAAVGGVGFCVTMMSLLTAATQAEACCAGVQAPVPSMPALDRLLLLVWGCAASSGAMNS